MIAYRTLLGLTTLLISIATARAQGPESAPASAPEPRWLAVPAPAGRLTAAQLGLVINTADPYSVAVGEYYIEKRRLTPEQVLRVALPVRGVLNTEEFDALREAIAVHFDARTQALALAWAQPWAVDCQSITGALALGLDSALCRQSCAPSRSSPYFASASVQPYADFGWRPSMLLAAPDVAAARALIDRGVAADGEMLRRKRPPAQALLLRPPDSARNVRSRLYPPAGPVRGTGVELRVEEPAALAGAERLLLVQTGAARLDLPPRLDWLPGALADHLTSFGGQLTQRGGQSSALEWIASGATASHGTVSEPCNHLQKFPHPQVLLLFYTQGATAIEAYWKSVAWPSQGVFVGEPLAAPFATPP